MAQRGAKGTGCGVKCQRAGMKGNGMAALKEGPGLTRVRGRAVGCQSGMPRILRGPVTKVLYLRSYGRGPS